MAYKLNELRATKMNERTETVRCIDGLDFRGAPSLKPKALTLWPIRLAWKNFVCRVGYGDWLIEYCEYCGRRQPLVWWTEDAIWQAVKRGEPGSPCPECFDREAAKVGIHL